MNHKGTVTLETERLILRRFVLSDLEHIFRNCWSDPKVWKWTTYARMNSIDDVKILNEIFTESWIERYEECTRYVWAIQLKATGEVIGRLTGTNLNEHIGQIELAYELGRKWWNQGFMTETVKAVIDFFFYEVGFWRIQADHARENPASGRIMQKCGMMYEGVARQGLVCNAGRFDRVIYAILADDYFLKNGVFSSDVPKDTVIECQFTDICLISNDVPGLVKFYETVFNVKVATDSDEIHSGLNIGGMNISIDSAKLMENSAFHYVSGTSSNNTIIGFNVDDVDFEYTRLLELGVTMLNKPTTHSWGARSFQFKDPDGNILNFRSLPKGN